MTNEDEHITRIERIKQGDNIISTKEIIEPREDAKKKKIFGLEAKDFFDLILKIAGLTTIILAWLKYTGEIEDKKILEADNKKREYNDSLKGLRARETEMIKLFHDSIQQIKENSREDTTLKIKQLEFYYAQEKDRKDLDQRNQQFQQEWINNLKEIENQKKEERQKIFAQTQLNIFLDVTTCLSSLIDNIEYGSESQSNIQKLNELILKTKLLAKDSLNSKLINFKVYADSALIYSKLQKNVNTIKASLQNLASNFCANRKFKLLDNNSIDTLNVNVNAINILWTTIQNELSEFNQTIQGYSNLIPDTTKERKIKNLNGLKAELEIEINFFLISYDQQKTLREYSDKKKKSNLSNGIAIQNDIKNDMCNFFWKIDDVWTKDLEEINELIIRSKSLSVSKLRHEASLVQDYMNKANIFLAQ
jgi:hypothetical protein